MHSLKLSAETSIPQIGFGTWQIPDGEESYNSVRHALDIGYRHIDTAAAYGNEKSVGKAIQESGIPRRELFVTTKLHNNMHGYDKTKIAISQSLDLLGMDYLDLYLIHWPNPLASRNQWKEDNAGSWNAMEESFDKGLLHNLGVSNFCERHLEALLETAMILPKVNQIKLFPSLDQNDLVEYCRSLGMVLEAYSPLGTGKLFSSPELITLSASIGKTPAQVALRHGIQKGYVVLPKSKTREYIKQNLQIFDFVLSEEQMQSLDAMDTECALPLNPDTTSF